MFELLLVEVGWILMVEACETKIVAFVYKVTGRDTGAFYTEDDAKARDAQMAQYSTQMVVPVMMDDADVKDNRARFF